MAENNSTRLREPYRWATICAGVLVCLTLVVAKLFDLIGFYALILTAPIIGIVLFTYRTYLQNIESAAAQTEQAEHHVQELSHFISEQARIREQFAQVEKLSALGELASGVAHDFNNTLAGILGRAQLLLRTDDLDKIQRGLNIIIKTAEDGAKTVKRIQDFARQRRDKDFELVKIDRVLTDVSEITRPRWKNKAEADNVHITFDLNAHSNAMVMGDEPELREVLINMVFNAIEAMPSGGKITLATEREGDSLIVSVTDTGIGMSPEVTARIFDPFYTTKGKAGLGLGLAVGFGIIRRHQGTIEVKSEKNLGTTFRMVFPIANELPAVHENSSSNRSISNGNLISAATKEDAQARILVVDDEDYVRELLRDILEGEGCRVFLAENGQSALELLEKENFSGVLTDVGMPGMSGWDLARLIRERYESIPIAVITGWGEAVGSDEQKDAGVDWVITKPFTAERIAELAKEISQHRHTSRAVGRRTIVAA